MTWAENKKSINILRIFLGLVFLSAGVFRIFNPGLAETEMISLHFPVFFSWVVIVLEIVGGLCLLFNRYVKKTLILFSVFLVVASILALVTSGKELVSNLSELFIYNLNPTDFFLHVTFLIIIITLLLNYKKK